MVKEVEYQIIEKAKQLIDSVKTRQELVSILSKEFSLSESTINVYLWENNFRTNFPPFRWKKGNIPWTMGLKGYTNSGSFKKGQKPWNTGLSIQTNTGKTHFKKGMTPWNKEKPMKEESKKKLSESLKKLYGYGKEPWNKNKGGYHFKTKRSPEYIEKLKQRERGKWTEEQKEKQSKTLKEFYEKYPEHRKVLSEAQIRAYQNNPELRKIHSETKKRLIKGNPELLKKMLGFRRPNYAELKLDDILNSYFPNTFKFVGYDFTLAKKFEGSIPDWLCEEKKLIIELCGEKFHTKEELQKRSNKFKELGYKMLVIWYQELKFINRNNLLEKNNNFYNDVSVS